MHQTDKLCTYLEIFFFQGVFFHSAKNRLGKILETVSTFPKEHSAIRLTSTSKPIIEKTFFSFISYKYPIQFTFTLSQPN